MSIEQAKVRITIDDFPGLILHADPQDLPPGAAREQINAMSSDVGRLDVRRGLTVVSFED
jgi:hypothetical protein